MPSRRCAAGAAGARTSSREASGPWDTRRSSRNRDPGPAGDAAAEYDGFCVRTVRLFAPNVPFVRNYFKNERLHARTPPWLRDIVRTERIDLVHGQHVLTCVPAVAAAHAEAIPAVCTVRDYWPVCYWSDLIHDPASATLCPGCTPGMMTRCIRPRAGPGVAARPSADSLHAAQPRPEAARAGRGGMPSSPSAR